MTQGFVPTWRERKWPVSKPTPARPAPMASSVKNPSVRKEDGSVKGGFGLFFLTVQEKDLIISFHSLWDPFVLSRSKESECSLL